MKNWKLTLTLCAIALCFLVVAAKWTDYGLQSAGNIADGDDFLVRDASDTSLASTGTEKRYSWASMKTDMTAAIKAGRTLSKGIILPASVNTTYTLLLWRTPVAITIRHISAVMAGGTTSIYLTGGLDYVDSDGVSNLTPVDTDIVINGGLDTDDGVLSNPHIAAGKWIRWHTTSVVGTPTGWTTVNIDYTED
jgi:hypothetical protein